MAYIQNSRLLFSRFTSVPVNGTSETTLYSNTVPARAFMANGDMLRFEYAGLFGTDVNGKFLTLKFNNLEILNSSDYSDLDTGTLSQRWTIEGSITRVSSSVVRGTATLGLQDRGYNSYLEITGLTLDTTSYIILLRGNGSTTTSITAVRGSGILYNIR